MFSEGLIILFACVSLVAFVATKNQTNELYKEDTGQHQVEENKE